MLLLWYNPPFLYHVYKAVEEVITDIDALLLYWFNEDDEWQAIM